MVVYRLTSLVCVRVFSFVCNTGLSRDCTVYGPASTRMQYQIRTAVLCNLDNFTACCIATLYMRATTKILNM